jgi:hypothetical protein
MLDVVVETVWGEIDGTDVVGTVDIVYKQGEQWISVGDVTESRGVFTLSSPQSTIGHEITLTTRHSWMGVDVYGPIYTFFNEPLGDFWAEDPATTDPPPADDPGTAATEPPPAVDPGTVAGEPTSSGSSEADANDEESVAESPPAISTDGSADAQVTSFETEDGSDEEAIDQFMAGLGADNEWYYTGETETEAEEDYTAFFVS